MIGAARHAGIARLDPVAAEMGIEVILALGGLHEDEVDSGLEGFAKVDVRLVARDVDPLDRHPASTIHT
jgi:hypothetical protein